MAKAPQLADEAVTLAFAGEDEKKMRAGHSERIRCSLDVREPAGASALAFWWGVVNFHPRYFGYVCRNNQLVGIPQAEKITDVQNFSQLLKTTRQQMGVSQAEMADLLDVSRNYVGMLEGGQREPSRKLRRNLDALLSRRHVPDPAPRMNTPEVWTVREEPLSPPPPADDPKDVSPQRRPVSATTGLYRHLPPVIRKARWDDLQKRAIGHLNALDPEDPITTLSKLESTVTLLEELLLRAKHGTTEPMP